MNRVTFLLILSLLPMVIASWLSSRGRNGLVFALAAGLVVAFLIAACAYTVLLPWWEWRMEAVQARTLLANEAIPIAVVLLPSCVSHLTAQIALSINVGSRRTRMTWALAAGLVATALVPTLLYVASCGALGECA